MAEPAALTACPAWLLPHWHDLYQRHQQGSLPHALLFTGMSGLGKRQFVRFVAESLLCFDCHPKTGACGKCNSCAQLTAGAHPELSVLNPEGASMNIKVDSVRQLVAWLQLSAPPGRYRAALIDTADAMNRNAANSLLKTLEEPGERAVLILAADQPGSLPATIRSRCQSTTLRIRDIPAALAWLTAEGVSDAEQQLEHSRVGPLGLLAQQSSDWQSAEQLLQIAWRDLFLMRASIGKIVDSLSDLPARRCLANFSRWALMANKQHLNVPVGADPAITELVSEVHDCLNSEQWFTFYDRMQQLHRSDSASFKTQAVLEGLFADIRLSTQG